MGALPLIPVPPARWLPLAVVVEYVYEVEE
jgi:hypothetical protein